MNRFILLPLLVVLLQGCSYAVSRDLVKKADRTIPFEALIADPDAYARKIVILGGVIVLTRNLKKGTLIEVIQKELDYWGEPKRTEKTGGRFLVFHQGTLDPLVFTPGRELTVAGEVAGAKLDNLVQNPAGYPIIVVKELKLFEKKGARTWQQPQWWDPLYDPKESGTRGY